MYRSMLKREPQKKKIGLPGPMPPGVLFAVYDSQTGNPDYMFPECTSHQL